MSPVDDEEKWVQVILDAQNQKEKFAERRKEIARQQEEEEANKQEETKV